MKFFYHASLSKSLLLTLRLLLGLDSLRLLEEGPVGDKYYLCDYVGIPPPLLLLAQLFFLLITTYPLVAPSSD
jgi:hypothetical protein